MAEKKHIPGVLERIDSIRDLMNPQSRITLAEISAIARKIRTQLKTLGVLDKLIQNDNPSPEALNDFFDALGRLPVEKISGSAEPVMLQNIPTVHGPVSLAPILLGDAQLSLSESTGGLQLNFRSHPNPIDMTLQLVNKIEGITPLHLIAIVCAASRMNCERVLSSKVNRDDIYITHNAGNPDLIVKNFILQYLRAFGIVPELPYDTLIQLGAYEFLNSQEPSSFAQILSIFRNGDDGSIVTNKNILTIGSGPTARDEQFYLSKGAQSVTIIERSKTALTALRQVRKNRAKDNTQLILPDEATDMAQALGEFVEQKHQFDSVISISSLHYDDDKQLIINIENITRILTPGGHLAVAIKAPGAMFDGSGILLHQRQKKVPGLEEDAVYHQAWYCLDGQIRHYRKADRLKKIFENIRVIDPIDGKQYGFDVTMDAKVEEHDYEKKGTVQPFLWFILTKVEKSDKSDQKSSGILPPIK